MVLNGKCVTVVAFTGLHFRAFYLLTFAASHDLKETIILIYCFLQGLRGRFPVNKLNPKKNYLNSPSAIALIEDAYSEGVIPDTFLNCLEK